MPTSKKRAAASKSAGKKAGRAAGASKKSGAAKQAGGARSRAVPTNKPKGLSLHIGLNFVDAAHYGSDCRLAGCVNDANDMLALARSRGFRPTQLLNQQATAAAVSAAISNAASQLKAGDIFFISYSGHGSQVPDKNGDEKDGWDETWVLYDRQLVDDELYTLWAQFAPGVRVLMLSDSCHSGSVARAILFDQLKNSPLSAAAPLADPTAGTRTLPQQTRDFAYRNNKALYDGIQQAFRSGDKVAVNASVILLSGCQDNQLSQDGNGNGLFTQTLLKVWNKGQFQGRYRKFWESIAQQMPPWQSPNFYRTGVTDASFEAQTPFTI